MWRNRLMGLVAVGGAALLTACTGSTTPPASSGPASTTKVAAPVDRPSPTAVPGLGKVVATYRSFAGPLAVLDNNLYVSNGLDPHERLQRVDVATGRLSGGVRTPPGAAYQVTAGHGVLWLTHPQDDLSSPPPTISAVDVRAGRAISTLHEPNSPRIALVGRSVWALDASHNQVDEIDAARGSIIRKVTTGSSPFCVDHAFGSVWVGNHDNDTVTRIDPTSGRVLATVSVTAGPIQITAGAGSIWVAAFSDDSVTRIDPATNKVLAALNVTAAPDDITYADGAIWVSDAADGDVYRLDPSTNRVVDDIGLEVGHEGSFVAAAGGFLWVSMPGSATFKIDPHL